MTRASPSTPDSPRVLLIGADALERDRLVGELTADRFWTSASDSLTAALAWLHAESADVVLLDLDLPDSEGVDTLRRFRRVEPELPVVVVTGSDEPGLGSEVVRAGAQDCVRRGDADARRLTHMIRLAIERQRLQANAERERAREILSREVQLQIKDQVLSRVSHELRTPLTAIHALLSLMAEGFGGDLSDEQLAYVKDALASADQLDRLLADLLDTSRIALGRLELDLERLRVSDLIADAVRSVTVLASERGTWIDVDGGPPGVHIRGDGLRLAQVLVNLLTNAIKFAPRGGRVAISAEVPAGTVRLHVDDDGPGIPPEDRSSVFDSLHQLASAGRGEQKGLGLGLHIASEIAALHGGRIEVGESVLGGARFTVTLPATPGSEETP